MFLIMLLYKSYFITFTNVYIVHIQMHKEVKGYGTEGAVEGV